MSEKIIKLGAKEESTGTAKLFKPDPVTITLGDVEYRLVYDLNAFCLMEKMYDSVDTVIRMILGNPGVDVTKVTYNDAPVLAEEIKVDGTPLPDFIVRAVGAQKKASNADTLKLLWLGVLHDHATFDDDGNIATCDVTRSELGKHVTFSNLPEVNAKIIAALLRDLVPVNAEEKNPEAPEAQQE